MSSSPAERAVGRIHHIARRLRSGPRPDRRDRRRPCRCGPSWRGALADDPARRRATAVGGYTSVAVLSGLIGAAASLWQVAALRTAAWTARGLRVPSRNALLADATPREAYGRAYGFERMMDNLGAIGGPIPRCHSSQPPPFAPPSCSRSVIAVDDDRARPHARHDSRVAEAVEARLAGFRARWRLRCDLCPPTGQETEVGERRRGFG